MKKPQNIKPVGLKSRNKQLVLVIGNVSTSMKSSNMPAFQRNQYQLHSLEVVLAKTH